MVPYSELFRYSSIDKCPDAAALPEVGLTKRSSLTLQRLSSRFGLLKDCWLVKSVVFLFALLKMEKHLWIVLDLVGSMTSSSRDQKPFFERCLRTKPNVEAIARSIRQKTPGIAYQSHVIGAGPTFLRWAALKNKYINIQSKVS